MEQKIKREVCIKRAIVIVFLILFLIVTCKESLASANNSDDCLYFLNSDFNISRNDAFPFGATIEVINSCSEIILLTNYSVLIGGELREYPKVGIDKVISINPGANKIDFIYYPILGNNKVIIKFFNNQNNITEEYIFNINVLEKENFSYFITSYKKLAVMLLFSIIIFVIVWYFYKIKFDKFFGKSFIFFYLIMIVILVLTPIVLNSVKEVIPELRWEWHNLNLFRAHNSLPSPLRFRIVNILILLPFAENYSVFKGAYFMFKLIFFLIAAYLTIKLYAPKHRYLIFFTLVLAYPFMGLRDSVVLCTAAALVAFENLKLLKYLALMVKEMFLIPELLLPKGFISVILYVAYIMSIGIKPYATPVLMFFRNFSHPLFLLVGILYLILIFYFFSVEEDKSNKKFLLILLWTLLVFLLGYVSPRLFAPLLPLLKIRFDKIKK